MICLISVHSFLLCFSDISREVWMLTQRVFTRKWGKKAVYCQCVRARWYFGSDSSSQPTPLKHDVKSMWDCLTVSVNSGPVWESGVHLGAHRVHHTLIFIIVSEGPWPWKLVTVTKCNSWRGEKGETESRYTFKFQRLEKDCESLYTFKERKKTNSSWSSSVEKPLHFWRRRKRQFLLEVLPLLFRIFFFFKDFTFIPFLIFFLTVFSRHSWLVTTL